MKRILYLSIALLALLFFILPLNCYAANKGAYKGLILVNGNRYTDHYQAYVASQDRKHMRVFVDGCKVEETASYI